jgi:hypothetical protein
MIVDTHVHLIMPGKIPFSREELDIIMGKAAQAVFNIET